MKARIGLADPPWLPLARSAKGMGRSPQAYYDGLAIEQMCALPVKDLFAADGRWPRRRHLAEDDRDAPGRGSYRDGRVTKRGALKARQPIKDRAMTAAERQRRHRGVNLEASPAPMSKSEREDLLRLVRQREKVLKTAASQRSAELMADFEQQLTSIYSYDQDEVWRSARNAAEEEVAKGPQAWRTA